jgi:hypothetical protein
VPNKAIMMPSTSAMIDNRFLHNLAMERKARHSQMQHTFIPDVVRNTEEVVWDYDSETGYESDDMSGASEGEAVEDRSLNSNHEDSMLSQSTARAKLESLLSFAEDAGLDKPSARIALSKSMGDEDR